MVLAFEVKFDFTMVLSFLVGVLIGALIIFLIYLYSVIKGLSKKSKIKQVDEMDIDEEEIYQLIRDSKEQFKDKEKRVELGYQNHLISICKELAVDVARKYYPKSKYPNLEISLHEISLLGHYISDRIEQLFQRRILKLFSGMTLAKIFSIKDTTTKINNLGVTKVLKKSKISKVISYTLSAINTLNPAYWTRKLIISNAVKIVMNKIGLAIILIVGEETYKIYSKKALNVTTNSEIEDVNQIYSELEKEMEDWREEANEEKKS